MIPYFEDINLSLVTAGNFQLINIADCPNNQPRAPDKIFHK